MTNQHNHKIENNSLIKSDSKELTDNLTKKLKLKFSKKLIKKALLVQTPDSDQSSFHYAAGKRGRLYNYPPYGLALIASQLRKIGIEVDILNLNHEVLKAIEQVILQIV